MAGAVAARSSSSQNRMMRRLSSASTEHLDISSDLVKKLPSDRHWKCQYELRIFANRCRNKIFFCFGIAGRAEL